MRYPSIDPNTGETVFTMAADNNCDVTGLDIIIPSGADVTWKSPRNLRSNVIVESGGRLTIKCDVGLPKDARITVQPNGHLVIDGARIYNNCDGDYWDGIVVEGDYNKPQAYDIFNQTRYVGFLELRNGAVIEKAKIGIRTQVPGNKFTTGGLVQARDATFLNCQQRCIDMQNFQNTTLQGAKVGNLSYFIRCSFELDGEYSGSFDNFLEMAYLRKVDGIDFLTCHFTNSYPHSSQSFADERKEGIYAVDAGFRVEGTCAENPAPPDCSTFANSSFTGFDKAILTSKVGTVWPFRVSRTDFSDNLVGIYGVNVPLASITQCNFEVGSRLPPAQPASGDVANRGIHLYGCTGYQVEGNVLTGSDLIGTTNPVGILVQFSGQEANEIYRNTLHGLHCGNVSNGLNKDLEDPIVGLQYLCNENGFDVEGGQDNNDFDFAVPDIGATVLGIANSQGSANQAAGNTFTVDPTEAEGHFLNEEAAITYFRPPAPANYSMSTISLDDGIDNLCPSNLPGGGEEGILTDNEKEQYEQLYEGSTEVSEQTRAANMLARHYLVDTTGQDMDSLRYWLGEKGGLLARFHMVDSWLQEGNLVAAQTSLDAIPLDFVLSGESQNEYNHFNTLKNLQISYQQNGNDDEMMVANEQATLTQLVGAGDYVASRQAQNLLNDLAGAAYAPTILLPGTGGQQGLLAPPPGDSNMLSIGEIVQLEAIPNPATGHTVFHYQLPNDIEQGQLTVRSMDGQVVSLFNLDSNAGQLTWATENVAEGVYVFTLLIDGKSVSTGRLVIIK